MKAERQGWLDIAKGLAMGWIVLVHFVEQFTRSAYFGNPTRNWPPLAERIAQLQPLPIEGFDGAVVNSVRWLGLAGDQGVQIFIVASGLGLAMSALRASEPQPAMAFYSKRLMSIVPMWLTAHALFMLLGLVLAHSLNLTDWKTWASLVGLRSLPPVMYHFSPAWWFIGLLLQLYLVFPLLMRWLQRWGPARFFLIVGGGALLVRAVGLLSDVGFVAWWSRGGFFVTRLPEFVFGMALAAWLAQAEPPAWLRRSPKLVLLALVAIVLGNLLSFTLAGLVGAFLLSGAGWVLLFYALAPSGRSVLGRVCMWASVHSLALFLVHHTVILELVPDDLAARSGLTMLGYLALSLAVSVLMVFVLERLTAWVLRSITALRSAGGARLRRRALIGGLATLALLFMAEAAVRRFNPQEVLGWGERVSMQPDDRYGYKLVPNQSTRLRWLSYDYVVQTSALGFPAPDYPGPKPAGTLRILVTGDAYESAEGVDTAQSWPRLLEQRLRARGVAAEVLNLSVTGWGPNQYARVIEDFTPRFQPDLVLVGTFVNDFSDAQMSDADFRASIGFGRASQTGAWSWLRLSHLAAFVRSELLPRVRDALGTDEYGRGYFFGHYGPLERASLPDLQKGAAILAERLRSIRSVTEAAGARTLVLQVPAPAQVCPPDAVDYTPKKLHVLDTQRFDLDQPQRLSSQVCTQVGLPCIDLRPAFAGTVGLSACQRANLHWTSAGHAAVAAFVDAQIAALPASAR